MKYFAVSYKYDPENSGIAQTRPEHREFISRLHGEGKILGSGPHPDGLGGALIILKFDDESTEVAQVIDIMDQDPFWKGNLVPDRTIREWNPVINSF
ncbi:hypothetical protein CPHO_05000 [Corynebacterium phocae]|uniref:YCII-related domain-containing protein n=1 Tax=Corynebacterium phocae TaxID=161895 RepID=A0A1L7D2G6_9CORY|nr:YciI family protein [Corynebacterium phocae]APT92356.1 hypothetical protein CPHO_05000 [Corynebacterium phocae]KAA8724948.1 YciI family protein [Corynebacterium phocae]